MMTIIVSACLLGCECRYDGKSKPCVKVLEYLKNEGAIAVPVCPEQLGGLPTPRVPSERQRTAKGTPRSISRPGAVLMKDGQDVTAQYKKGAETALMIAKLNGSDAAIFKSGSPSCGKGLIYDGSFSGNKAAGNGVTADLFLSSGIKVLTEEDL